MNFIYHYPGSRKSADLVLPNPQTSKLEDSSSVVLMTSGLYTPSLGYRRYANIPVHVRIIWKAGIEIAETHEVK